MSIYKALQNAAQAPRLGAPASKPAPSKPQHWGLHKAARMAAPGFRPYARQTLTICKQTFLALCGTVFGTSYGRQQPWPDIVQLRMFFHW